VLKINCIHDHEGGHDAIDPLGTLSISDGQSVIVVKTTYLDSWLVALIGALEQIRSVDHSVVEVSEEQRGIHLHRTADGRVHMSYDGTTVVAESWRALESSIRTAANIFLKTIDVWPSAGKNEFLKPIRRFVGTTPN
jgi:hypothetical protein